MKSIVLYFFLLSFTSAHCQDNSWLFLELPMEKALGKKIDMSKFKKDDRTVTIDANFDAPNIPRDSLSSYTETSKSASSSQFIRSKTLQHILGGWNNSSSRIVDAYAKNIVIDALDDKGMQKIRYDNNYYIWSGIRADSLHIKFKTKRSNKINAKPLVDSLINKLLPAQANFIKPLLDSVYISKEDSTEYDLIVVNPNVYYAVKAVKLKQKGIFQKYSTCFDIGEPSDCTNNCKFPRQFELSTEPISENYSRISVRRRGARLSWRRRPFGYRPYPTQIWLELKEDNSKYNLVLMGETQTLHSTPYQSNIKPVYQQDRRLIGWEQSNIFAGSFAWDNYLQIYIVDVKAIMRYDEKSGNPKTVIVQNKREKEGDRDGTIFKYNLYRAKTL